MNCNPTILGIVLRLVIAFLFISYGMWKQNYLILAIGLVPIVRLSYYFFTKLH